MRYPVFIAFIHVLLLTGCGNDSTSRKPDLEDPKSVDILADTANGRITFTTSYTKGIIGMPVWQVYREVDGEKTALFTIERAWQEAEPDLPVLNSDKSAITDARQSYIFSLSELRFITNRHKHLVYGGEYQQ